MSSFIGFGNGFRYETNFPSKSELRKYPVEQQEILTETDWPWFTLIDGLDKNEYQRLINKIRPKTNTDNLLFPRSIDKVVHFLKRKGGMGEIVITDNELHLLPTLEARRSEDIFQCDLIIRTRIHWYIFTETPIHLCFLDQEWKETPANLLQISMKMGKSFWGAKKYETISTSFQSWKGKLGVW